jgi:hypothetical protein
MAEQFRERRPWERQPGEGQNPYLAFVRYRDLGESRSVRQAVDVKQVPKKGQDPYWHWWYRWSQKWHWRQRARAYDDWRNTQRQKAADDAVVQSAIAETEENERQRKLRLREARQLAETAQGGIVTAAPVALARLRAAQDEVRSLIAGNATPKKVTAAIADAVAVLGWATKSLEVAHKLEALALGKATDRTAVVLGPDSIDALAQIIMRRLPETEWEAVGEEVVVAFRGNRVNDGHGVGMRRPTD